MLDPAARPDLIGMSEYLGQMRGEVDRMPPRLRPIGSAILEALTAARDRMLKDDAQTTHLRALLRRAHDAMSRREPDGVPVAEWDQLLAEIAKEIG